MLCFPLGGWGEYLSAISGKRREKDYFNVQNEWSDYPALVFALFRVRACMLDLLLPPKCLGRRGRIILVTHAVSSQFVFGHK